MELIPREIFFTKGLGIHKDKLASFELALRRAGIEKCNLVYVSSIFPPNCMIIPRKVGLKRIKPGQITFCVMARNETNEPNRLISSAVGLAVPKEKDHYGYISEHHSYGETARKAGDYAEDLAATMLATRKQVYKASNYIFKSTNICQSSEGNKHGKWTTAIAAAVMLL
jgi:arginine decarboxylase